MYNCRTHVNMSKNVACRREMHGLCPINRFHSRVSAIYCVATPSFRRRGHILQKKTLCYHLRCVEDNVDMHLNTPTLFASTPSLNVEES